MKLCTKPQPEKMYCTREDGHEGPCAVVKKPSRWSRIFSGAGEALGEALFGGSR